MLSDDSFESSIGSMSYVEQLNRPDTPTSDFSKSDYECDSSDDICSSCKKPIQEQHLLKVRGFHRPWHVRCLRCCICDVPLDSETSCYYRANNIYCKSDYTNQRSKPVTCSKCQRPLGPTDWVRRAKDHLYHLACFACDACKRQLSTGEEFALHDDKLLCKLHYVELATGGGSENDGEEGHGIHKQKTKRIRTSFTEEQLRILHANFRIDSNPDGQDLERIAQQTGLSKRVTQVWFQNSRARQKKHQSSSSPRIGNCNGGTGGGVGKIGVGHAHSPSIHHHHHLNGHLGLAISLNNNNNNNNNNRASVESRCQDENEFIMNQNFQHQNLFNANAGNVKLENSSNNCSPEVMCVVETPYMEYYPNETDQQK